MIAQTTLLLAALAAGAANAASVPQHEHHGAHGEAAAPQLVLNKGAKWQTDEALRTGMQRVRQAVERHAGHAHSIAPDKGAKLAADVQGGVAYMVENCKLAPEADAVLHVLIADMLKGADLLANPHHANEGLALVHGALEKYPAYFQHDGWH